ncbi:MAG: hypothetical protein V4631_10090 [Pseudomonadota bacterium]
MLLSTLPLVTSSANYIVGIKLWDDNSALQAALTPQTFMSARGAEPRGGESISLDGNAKTTVLPPVADGKAGQPGALLLFRSHFAYDAASGKLVERRLPDGQLLRHADDSVDGKLSSVTRVKGWLAWVDSRISEALAGVLRA